MALTDGQIPKLANVINGGLAVLTGATTAGVLGTNNGGQTVYTPGAFGGRVYSLIASTNHTIATVFFVYILKGGTMVKPVGIINNAISAGNISATKNTDCLNNVQILGLPIDNTGKVYIPLEGDEILRVSYLTLSANNIWITAMGLDYQS